MYFLGIAIGATVTIGLYHESRSIVFIRHGPTDAIGRGMVGCTVPIIFGFILNEFLQFFSRTYNYRSSLDPNIQRENEEYGIFDSKIYKIDGKENQYDHLNLDDKKMISKFSIREVVFIIFSLVSRILSIICLYYPFIYLNSQIVRNVVRENEFYAIHWMSFGGLIFFTICLYVTSTKPLFSWACILAIIGLHLQTIFTSLQVYSELTMAFMKVLFFIFGCGYALPNIITFETINLKYMDIIQGLGYSAEMIAFGTIMHSVVMYTDEWFCEHINCGSFDYTFFQHGLSFVLLLVFANFFGYYAIPKVPANVSLLESKNATKLKLMGYSAMEQDKGTYYPRNWDKDIFSPRDNNENNGSPSVYQTKTVPAETQTVTTVQNILPNNSTSNMSNEHSAVHTTELIIDNDNLNTSDIYIHK